MAVCKRCGCCEAQTGFTLCIFCEDGVACPNRKRAGSLSAPPPLPAVSSKVQTNHHPESPRAAGNLTDQAKQLGTTSSREKQPQEIQNNPRKEKRMPRFCACGCGNPVVNRHPYLKGHNPAGKQPKALSSDKAKVKCRRPGCNVMIRANTKSGCCAKDFYWSTKNPVDIKPRAVRQPLPPPQFQHQGRQCRSFYRQHQRSRIGARPLLGCALLERESGALRAATRRELS